MYNLSPSIEPTIGERTVALLKAIATELSKLGSEPIFWVVFSIIVFTMLISILKTRSADGIFNKIEEAFYDSVSLLISLFYDIIGVFSVLLNFIRTLTEMLFGDLSENLLKRLFAFAIIAFSITSFSTTFEGMTDLFKWTAALVSFGVQILVLGLTYKLVLLLDDNISKIVYHNKNKTSPENKKNDKEYKPDKKQLYNQSIKKPLLIVSLYTILPVVSIMIYLYYEKWWMWIITFVVIIFYIIELSRLGTFNKFFKAEGLNEDLENKEIDLNIKMASILYFLLGLSIFVSSFFSYTSISDQFVDNQINTDYLIATSTRAIDDLETMENTMQESTNEMVNRMNVLLKIIEDFYTKDTGDIIFSPQHFEDNYSDDINEALNQIKEDIESESKRYIVKLGNEENKIIEIENNIIGLDQDEADEYKRENDYNTTVQNAEEYNVIVELLSDFSKDNNYSVIELKKYLEILNIDTNNEGLRKYNSLILNYKNGLPDEWGIEVNNYIDICNSIQFVESFLVNIEYYDLYGFDKDRELLHENMSTIKNSIAKYNEIDLGNGDISMSDVDAIINNLLYIEEYYTKSRTDEVSPKDEIQNKTKEFFLKFLDSDDKQGEQIVARETSLDILQILFGKVVSYPNLDSVGKIGELSKFKSISFIEIEQEVYVQIRTLNGEMKPFEKYLRKLFDRDAFPDMSVFALFIALLIDTAVAILFILRGKDGPYSDTKLNSKRVIYLHAVENNKTPKKMKMLVRGAIVNCAGIVCGIVAYVIHKSYQPNDIESIYLLIYILAGLILSNSLVTLFSIFKGIREQSSTESDKEANENHYGQFTLKYDVKANSTVDKFYDCPIFKDDRENFYYSKLYWRYIERLRERFLDTFVLFLCEMKTIETKDKDALIEYIDDFNSKNTDKDKQLSVHSYVAWIKYDVAEKYKTAHLLRSLLAYDHKIVIITNDKYYINSNFFKYVNELLWSRNSQYSNYGLDYSDYDIDEAGLNS